MKDYFLLKTSAEDIYILCDRPRAHSIAHGKQVCEQFFYTQEYKKAAATQQRKKRVLMQSDVQLMQGPMLTPGEQIGMEFLEVPVDPKDCFAGALVLHKACCIGVPLFNFFCASPSQDRLVSPRSECQVAGIVGPGAAATAATADSARSWSQPVHQQHRSLWRSGSDCHSTLVFEPEHPYSILAPT